jgi:hypothetical protein
MMVLSAREAKGKKKKKKRERVDVSVLGSVIVKTLLDACGSLPLQLLARILGTFRSQAINLARRRLERWQCVEM